MKEVKDVLSMLFLNEIQIKCFKEGSDKEN